MSYKQVSRAIVFAALVASLLVIMPSPAAAQRVGIGFYGGYWGPGPFWGPVGWGYYPGYAYGPYGYGGRPIGEVKIKSPDSHAQIYINGSLAGQAHDLKRFYLAPGTYNIEQRIGSDVQKARVYVVANRSLKIEFEKPGVAHNQPYVFPPTPPPPPPAREPAPPVPPPPPAPQQ